LGRRRSPLLSWRPSSSVPGASFLRQTTQKERCGRSLDAHLESVRTPKPALSAPLPIRFPAAQRQALDAHADRSCLSLGAAVRGLVARGLEPAQPDGGAAMAALLAAEHVLCLLQLIVPDGAAQSSYLAQAAAAAAERRLAGMVQAIAQEEGE